MCDAREMERGFGSYRAISRIVAGFFAIAAFFVGTLADEMTGFLAFFAHDFVHVHRFLRSQHPVSK